MESNAPLTFAAVQDCSALTIRQLIDRYAQTSPEKAFAVFPDTGSELSWSQLQATCHKLNAYLHSLGAVPGDRIGMLSVNGLSLIHI